MMQVTRTLKETWLAGPSGCGKTAVLGVLAREMGFELCEWRAPVPTLWDEHLYQVRSACLV